MGEVYRARDTRLDRRVAVKILPSQPGRPTLHIRHQPGKRLHAPGFGYELDG